MAKKRLILFLAAGIVILLVYYPGCSRLRSLKLRQIRMEKRIEELEEANRRLEEEKYRLENDIEYIEKRAREKLGVVKEDEIPYRIMEE